MAGEVVVSMERVSKTFLVPNERYTSLKQLALNGFRSAGHRIFDALNDVSLEVRRGEFFSVIGQNGSGKSTLLKILAGIYTASAGRVMINGWLSPFIELGVGFSPDLTARENIFLNGAVLGLTRREVIARFDEIVRFAELQAFVDQKLKNFSSGMLVRLAFAVAIQAHAEILLIDEVLAVGDANFQQKCFDAFRRFKAEGRTIMFVSHDMGSVKEFSDRVLVLNRGRAHGIFSPAAAIAAYSRLNDERANQALFESEPPPKEAQVKRGLPQVLEVQLFGADGQPTHVLHRGEQATVKLRLRNPDLRSVNLGVAIYRSDGLYCFGTNTFEQPLVLPRSPEVTVALELPCFSIQRGSYSFTVGLFGESATAIYEMRDQIQSFRVSQSDGFEGVVHLAHQWRLC